MKNQHYKTKASSAEVGAGLGLMLICGIMMIISPESFSSLMLSAFIGLMMALGVFSDKKNTSCKKK